jgi:hypothetical protein
MYEVLTLNFLHVFTTLYHILMALVHLRLGYHSNESLKLSCQVALVSEYP